MTSTVLKIGDCDCPILMIKLKALSFQTGTQRDQYRENFSETNKL